MRSKRQVRVTRDEVAKRYPQHEKLIGVVDESQAVGEFLTWLSEVKGVLLGKWDQEGHKLTPHNVSVTELLGEYYGIDLKKLDEEKAAMLEVLREAEGEEQG